MTTEEKFNAAVNVIRSLPKNGSYQPSNDLMLRFYAYYKQAKEGPCTGKRPPFYNLVERAKYDAWKGLQNMNRQQAMAKYVDELHTIVETMSYSDKVANFLEAPSDEVECVNMIMDDLELIAGDVLEKVRSRPNSPLASREASPLRGGATSSGPTSTSNSLEDSDRSDDEYIDTIEYPDPKKYPAEQLSNGYFPKGEHISRTRTKSQTVDVSQEITKAVQSLKADIERLNNKIQSLERSHSVSRKNQNVSFEMIVLIIVWPVIASFIMNRYFFKNRK